MTDEHAFGVLQGDDVGVKVGPGETAATLRINDPRQVADLLTALAAARQARQFPH